MRRIVAGVQAAAAEKERVSKRAESDGADVVHHHYLSSGGHTLTHAHPGGHRDHEGRHPGHKQAEWGAYWSHPGPAPTQGDVAAPAAGMPPAGKDG